MPNLPPLWSSTATQEHWVCCTFVSLRNGDWTINVNTCRDRLRTLGFEEIPSSLLPDYNGLIIIKLYRCPCYYNDVIMSVTASQITSFTIIYSTVYSGTHQRKHQCPASLAFVRGIHRWSLNSPTKGQQRGKCFHLMTSSSFHSSHFKCLYRTKQSETW